MRRYLFGLSFNFFKQTCMKSFSSLKLILFGCDNPKTNRNVNSRHFSMDRSISSILYIGLQYVIFYKLSLRYVVHGMEIEYI